MSRIRSLPPTLAILLLGGTPALAQTTAAEATALQTAIHGFFDRMVGVPAVSDALTPKVTAEGDHIRLELAWTELGPIEGYKMGPGKITANAKSLSGGRWALDDIRIPDKLSGGGEITPAGAPKPVPIGFSMAIAKQTGSMIFDPTLATTSSADSLWNGYTMTVDGVQGTQISNVDTAEAHNVWQPRGDGRLDMRTEVIFGNYSITTPTPGGTPVKVTMNRVTQKAQLKNFAMAALGALLQDSIALGRAQMAPDAKPGAPQDNPQIKAMARRAIDVLASLMDGLEGDTTISGLRVAAMGADIGIKTISIGTKFGAEDGALTASFPMLLEGIDAGDLVKGPLGEVMPRKIAITPTASGISKKALVALAQRGVDGKIVGDAAWQAAFLKLLADNPVTLGFEDLAVDFGVAKLEGGGELEISSATEITGKAEFHVTGLDALIRRANAAPELKDVAPVLIFLKGIGEQDGKDTVWRIAYEDGKTTINDTDLSDIMPGKDAGPGVAKKKR